MANATESRSGEVTVVLRREDAEALVHGPLGYTMRVAEGKVPDGGSPWRARIATALALGYDVEESPDA